MLNTLKSRMYISLLIFILVFATSFVMVYAYFQVQEQKGIMIQTGDFEVEMLISFNSTVIDINSPYYDQETGSVIINAYDSESENYVGNLNISFVVTSIVASRFRIKLQEEWTLTRHYLDQNPLYPIPDTVEVVYHTNHGSAYYPFSLLKLAPTFSPIYDLQGYAYLTEIIPKGDSTVIDFIQSGDGYNVRINEVFTETCYLHLDLMIDVVQANRFSEVWNIDPNFFN
ncbi:MAG: hypothetical protein JXC31_05685 [Acholeplasmataceae bacterium]|nr:hypothetical protein [Acholeplasmataceae bacterium]